ncbi:MAG: hypothetical protein INR68_12690 [Methylobacterium mesophilicum]|nr:hypothetical protein [Methylobacterium mesophilicum]
MDLLTEIDSALAPHGLTLRGGFDFGEGEDAPRLPSGMTARALLLVGNAGGAFWPAFQTWRTAQPCELQDPLDAWSRAVIGSIAEEIAAYPVLPSDRAYWPFQRWAMRAEGLRASPLGILMHPRYGLWHAYRGALLFDRPLSLGASGRNSHLCSACEAQPCRTRCPVQAHRSAALAYDACLGHLHSQAGKDCMEGGCLDRNACPHGADYRYQPALQAFLMEAFRR